VQLPDNQTFVINAGDKEGDFDSGEYVVIPFLNKYGITVIDKLILTDASGENINSAKSVAEDVKIEQLLMPQLDGSTEEIEDALVESISHKLIFLDSIKEISDERNELRISFFDYPSSRQYAFSPHGKIVKISYKDTDFCLLDGIKKMEFDSGFGWDRITGCEVLVMSELGDYESAKRIIQKIKPQQIIFTRHYLRYEKDKIPTLMALEFPQIECHRTLNSGAIICKTDGEKMDLDFTIHEKP
jgi:beta-lactamase superfamily II metal-dependent hydrolase